jgi:hypothetical protein
MPSTSDALQLLELAQRTVRTLEGARLYGKPIGSPIGEPGDGEDDGQQRPITIERLKSLQSQFEAAKRVGNTALMKDIQAEFASALSEYREVRQDPMKLRDLVAARGRNAQATQKAS